jgi:hypothetical protein
VAGSQHRLLDLNVLLHEFIEDHRFADGGRLPLDARLQPGLPRVLGHPGQLRRAVGDLVRHAERALARRGGGGRILVESMAMPGVLRGESFARLRVRVEGQAPAGAGAPAPAGPGSDRDLALAASIAALHGGVVSSLGPDEETGSTLDLRAA